MPPHPRCSRQGGTAAAAAPGACPCKAPLCTVKHPTLEPPATTRVGQCG
jgi:hypothetical protein